MQADGWVYFKRKDPNDKNSFSTWILLRDHDCHIPQHLGYDFLEDVPARIAPTIAECRHCHRQYEYYWPKRGNGYWRLRDVQELQIIQHS